MRFVHPGAVDRSFKRGQIVKMVCATDSSSAARSCP
uniref:Uncharacterized protein n=1 Tax=Trichinella nativa TaxID=6335 RepID=A0A0V1KHE6_9BILA